MQLEMAVSEILIIEHDRTQDSRPLPVFDACLIWTIKYRVVQKSHYRENTEYLYNGSTKRAPFFLPRIEACSHSKFIRARLVRTFVTYHYWLQQENFTFSQIWKQITYSTKVLISLVRTYLRYEHVSILGEKMSTFGPAVMYIFSFFLGSVTFAPPCIYIYYDISSAYKVNESGDLPLWYQRNGKSLILVYRPISVRSN